MRKICRGRVDFSWKHLRAFAGALFLSHKAGENLILEFEREFSLFVRAKQAIAVSCAKTALRISLKALKAESNDEIIVPAYTVPEVIDVVVCSGLKPVFVDVSLQDGNITPELIEQKISAKTKFILMTHMHGNLSDIDSIINISNKYGITVIEDAAQACGAEYKGKRAGVFGKIAYFSFGILKNINTLGGGMIVTDDDNLALEIRKLVSEFKPISKIELVRRLLKAGILTFFTAPFVFSKVVYPVLRLLGKFRDRNINKTLKVKPLNNDDLEKFNVLFVPAQASVGLLQINTIDRTNQHKVNNAKVLDEKLSVIKQVSIFHERENAKNIYLNYVLRIKNRKGLINFLFDMGIDTSPGFVRACSYMKEFALYASECPNSLVLEQENVYLPTYLPLNHDDMIDIASLVKTYYETKTTI